MVTDAAARKRLQEETVQDVAHCLSVETTRLEVVGMHNAEDEHRGMLTCTFSPTRERGRAPVPRDSSSLSLLRRGNNRQA
jgi:hypothetical protein